MSPIGPLISDSEPSSAAVYEDTAPAPGAPPKASLTIKSPRLSKAKPNGVCPTEACEAGPRAQPARGSRPDGAQRAVTGTLVGEHGVTARAVRRGKHKAGAVRVCGGNGREPG